MKREVNKIRELRKKNGMTQSDLAKKINVTPQVVSNWERNYTTPDINHIQTLSFIFDVSTDYLLSIDKEKNHPTSDGPKKYVFDEDDEKIKELLPRLSKDEKQWLIDTMLRIKRD